MSPPSTPNIHFPTQQYSRLAGKGHAKDGYAAEDTLPADIADPLQPLTSKEAMLEGGQHNLHQGESEAQVRAAALGLIHQVPRSWEQEQISSSSAPY